MHKNLLWRQRLAVQEIRGWTGFPTMEDGTKYEIRAPINPQPIIDCLGQIYKIMVWPNNAETILRPETVSIIDRHNAWHEWRFVRVKIELVEPDYVIESAIMPNADALAYLQRKGLGRWVPDGYGWKYSNDPWDEEPFWHRTRTWELFDEPSRF